MVTGIGSVVGPAPSNKSMMNGVTGTQTPPAEPVKRPSDNRRSNKPLMEKRRRLRINNCLNELKLLILDATKKDPARHSKLEKADILEKTVKHLQDLQRQQLLLSQASDPNILNKFKAGFTECANEVGRFPGLDTAVKRRLLQHLSNCINGVKNEAQIPHAQPIQPAQQQSAAQVHILPSPPSSPEQEQTMHQQVSHVTATPNGYFLMNGSGTGVQLIPTKLSNGNIAFVFPQSLPQSTPLPMLIPIPTRTASTASAASNSSSNYERVSRENVTSPASCYAPPSPANSYEAMDCQTSPPSTHSPQHTMTSSSPTNVIQRPYSPAPLSLVIKKTYESPQVKEDEKPWRPW